MDNASKITVMNLIGVADWLGGKGEVCSGGLMIVKNSISHDCIGDLLVESHLLFR
ncbi:hypothetical protein VN12_05515 [Pirellula sp. SH-Sr6A]|nr:hypothetical protein VN12_05515 [Pirellula sp. SH-Sr6A]